LVQKIAGLLLIIFVLMLPYAALGGSTFAPEIFTNGEENGATLVSIRGGTPGATIYYTIDGSTPTATSAQYFAPFLVTSSVTIKTIAIEAKQASKIATQKLDVQVAPGALVWSDEFGGTAIKPDATIWTYDSGGPAAFGNHELEIYCDPDSDNPPCDSKKPNAYTGTDGYLHIVARKFADGTYTSARLKTQGLFSLRYGRVEARIRIPEAQGMWPAFWLLGNDIPTANWPACGEQDVMEHVNGPLPNSPAPDWIEGSVHGTGFIGDVGLGTKTYAPAKQSFSGWHTYGMIWAPGSVAYYVDDPAHPYATYTPADIKRFNNAVWPFDEPQSDFLILNLAVGGDWPGAPNATTPFPAEMLVDYVRVFNN
jgi:beta-glucanase (GH16 family)